jgi:hypothetical protein
MFFFFFFFFFCMKEEGSHFWCVCESAQPGMIWMVCKNDVWAFNGKWHMIHDTTIEDGIFGNYIIATYSNDIPKIE